MKTLSLNNRGAIANGKVIFGVIIALLLAGVLISALGGTIFSNLGTGVGGLGNTTANPSVPTYLPTILIALFAFAIIFAVYKLADL